MDLIGEACREQGMTLDEAGFDQAIEEQRTRARKTGGFEQETARPPSRSWPGVSGRRNLSAMIAWKAIVSCRRF